MEAKLRYWAGAGGDGRGCLGGGIRRGTEPTVGHLFLFHNSQDADFGKKKTSLSENAKILTTTPATTPPQHHLHPPHPPAHHPTPPHTAPRTTAPYTPPTANPSSSYATPISRLASRPSATPDARSGTYRPRARAQARRRQQRQRAPRCRIYQPDLRAMRITRPGWCGIRSSAALMRVRCGMCRMGMRPRGKCDGLYYYYRAEIEARTTRACRRPCCPPQPLLHLPEAIQHQREAPQQRAARRLGSRHRNAMGSRI